jgi:hypothetical protein
MAFDYGLGSNALLPNWTDSSYDQPVYDDTVPTDIVMAQAQPEAVAANDSWSSWFKSAGVALLDYGIKKDIAQTGASLSQTVRQPVYQQQAYQARTQEKNSSLLIIGAVVVAVLVLSK